MNKQQQSSLPHTSSSLINYIQMRGSFQGEIIIGENSSIRCLLDNDCTGRWVIITPILTSPQAKSYSYAFNSAKWIQDTFLIVNAGKGVYVWLGAVRADSSERESALLQLEENSLLGCFADWLHFKLTLSLGSYNEKWRLIYTTISVSGEATIFIQAFMDFIHADIIQLQQLLACGLYSCHLFIYLLIYLSYL